MPEVTIWINAAVNVTLHRLHLLLVIYWTQHLHDTATTERCQSS